MKDILNFNIATNDRFSLYKILTATILTGLIIAISVSLFTPFYETNDDVVLMLVYSGGFFTEGASEYFLYNNIILGKTLSTLYELYPGFDWYASYQFSLLSIALLVLIFLALKDKFNVANVSIVLLCVLTINLESFVSVQFTKTAFFATMAGLFLVLSSLCSTRAEQNKSLGSWSNLLGISLIISAQCLRMNASLALISCTIPLLLYFFVTRPKIRKSIIHFLIIIFVSTMALYGANYIYLEQHPDWKYSHDLNKLKSEFTDKFVIKYIEEFKEDPINWSKNDFQMMKYWGYQDKEVFNKTKVKRAIETWEESHSDILANASFNIKDITRISRNNSYQYLAILILTVCVCCFRKENYKYLLIYLGSVLVFLLFLLIVLWLPPRVYSPALASVVWLILILTQKTNTETSFRGKLSVLLVLVFCATSYATNFNGISNVYKKSQEVELHNKTFQAVLSKIAESNFNKLILWGRSFPYEYILPFEQRVYLKGFKAYGLGTTNQTPIQSTFLEEEGIKDILLEMVNSDQILFALGQTQARFLQKYMFEHYNYFIRFIPMNRDPIVQFYRIRGGKAPPAKPQKAQRD